MLLSIRYSLVDTVKVMVMAQWSACGYGSKIASGLASGASGTSVSGDFISFSLATHHAKYCMEARDPERCSPGMAAIVAQSAAHRGPTTRRPPASGRLRGRGLGAASSVGRARLPNRQRVGRVVQIAPQDRGHSGRDDLVARSVGQKGLRGHAAFALHTREAEVDLRPHILSPGNKVSAATAGATASGVAKASTATDGMSWVGRRQQGRRQGRRWRPRARCSTRRQGRRQGRRPPRLQGR